MRDTFLERDAEDFHRKFGFHIGHLTKSRPPQDEVNFRIDRIQEESAELVEALREGHVVKIAHEAIDVLYVVVGCLVMYGIPLMSVWAAVHAANMRKEFVGRLKKPRKPESWVTAEADVRSALLVEIWS